MTVLDKIEKPSQYFTIMFDNLGKMILEKEDFFNILNEITIETIILEESFNTYKTTINDINVTVISYYYLSVINRIQIWMDIVADEDSLLYSCARLSWDFTNSDFDDAHNKLLSVIKNKNDTIQKYSTGTKSEKPSQESIILADFITSQCIEKSLHHDISVWDDGTLCIECTTQEHDDIFINLFTDGVLDIAVYNYKTHDWDINLPNASKQDFVKIFE